MGGLLWPKLETFLDRFGIIKFGSYTNCVRKKIFVGLITVLGIYLSYSLATGAYQSYQNAGRLIEVETDLKKAQEENDRLKAELEYKSSGYFIEKEARERLGLAKPGETVVITPTPTPKPEGEKSEFADLSIQELWWKVFFK